MAILLFALGLGVGIGLLTNLTVPGILLNYLAVMVLAALDSCIGGVRASLEESFSDKRFLAGFAVNVVIAAFVVFLGDSVGLRELYLAAAVPFVMRMFANLAAIRDYWLARRGWGS